MLRYQRNASACFSAHNPSKSLPILSRVGSGEEAHQRVIVVAAFELRALDPLFAFDQRRAFRQRDLCHHATHMLFGARKFAHVGGQMPGVVHAKVDTPQIVAQACDLG